MNYDRSIYDKKYYLKNKDKIKEYLREYYKEHKEKLKQRARDYHRINREIIKEKHDKYYTKNKEYFRLKNKMYAIKNREKLKSYTKKYNLNRRTIDKNFNMRGRLRSRLYVALRKYGFGKNCLANKYGIDYDAIFEHLKPFPKEISKYHIDHIKPLCSFDLTDPKQIKIAFSPKNHQWLLAEQNMKKGASI